MTPPTLSTSKITGVALPHTHLITIAITFAHTYLTTHSYNHVMRSFLFSSIIAAAHPDYGTLDQEVIALSTILHDVSWSGKGEFSSKDNRHEVNSAITARDFVRQQTGNEEGRDGRNGWDKHRLQLLWNAIALHGIESIWRYKEPEVVVVGMGISADFTGPGSTPHGLPTQEQRDAVEEKYPRLGLTECGMV